MSGQGIAQFIPLILIFVIFYFFLIRPQQKKVKEHKLMVENLKRGDKVDVSISENVNVEVIKSTGIQSLVSNTETKK